MRRNRLATLAIGALLCVGCGQQGRADPVTPGAQGTTDLSGVHAHPQAVEPIAGAAPAGGASSSSSAATQVSVGSSDGPLPQPVSDSAIRQELAASGLSPNPNQAALTANGLAISPVDAPAAVQEVIAAGNQIAHLPYRYGGGHITYEDTAYDCSGSISYVFEAAHLLGSTLVSGDLETWGDPGPGKWITVFANAGHTFMYVAGLRFDTVALAETGSRWSNRSADEPDLSTFAVRHPPGL
jgi:hypothetical protein